MSLRVLAPGLYTLVVDFGRPHCRSLGVAVGGAADRTSLMLGNALVGNPPNAAALEITLAGPTLQAGGELACVLYGAPFFMSSDRQELTAGKTFTLTPGETLRVGGTNAGRAYLCVRGGLQTQVILGSRSGLQPLQRGEELPCLPGRIHPRFFLRDSVPESVRPDRHDTLRVLDGAHVGLFPRDCFLTTADWDGLRRFKVSTSSNRMGLRLQGEPLPVPDGELVSEPVCPGTVQVTRNGQCIILGVDGQTIGGYPKIAQVISADLDRLGQLLPGDEVYFVGVSQEEAEAFYRHKREALDVWLNRLRLSLRDWERGRLAR